MNIGSNNDAKVWNDSTLKQALDKGHLHLPPGDGNIEFHFIGDDIFPLSTRLIKPYTRGDHLGVSEKIYNYRYSLNNRGRFHQTWWLSDILPTH